MPKRKFLESFESDLYQQQKKIIKWAKEFQDKAFFIPKKYTKERFLSSYGPRTRILFVGDSNEDDITEEKGALNKLSSIFNEGINNNNCSSGITDFIPYFKDKYNEDLIRGDITKGNSLSLIGDFAFSYVIDTSKGNNIVSFPMIPFNTSKYNFYKGSYFDQGDYNKSFFILPSSLFPHHIVGAFANEALAHSLDICQDTLIINPNYTGERLEEIKTKLNINITKQFNECTMNYPDYDNATKAYYSR